MSLSLLALAVERSDENKEKQAMGDNSSVWNDSIIMLQVTGSRSISAFCGATFKLEHSIASNKISSGSSKSIPDVNSIWMGIS